MASRRETSIATKGDEEVKLIVKKMGKFCKLSSAASEQNQNQNKNQNQKQKQQLRQGQANNNDENFVSGYPKSSGRISGGSSKSSLSNYYDDGEEDTNQLILSSSPSDESNSLVSSASSSSGRSSANKSPDSGSPEVQAIKSRPSKADKRSASSDAIKYYVLVDKIRVRVLAKLRGNEYESGNDEGQVDEILFDEIDLIEFEKPLPEIEYQEQSLTFRLISRYLNVQKVYPVLQAKDEQQLDEDLVKPCTEQVVNFLKFRHQYQLNNCLEEQFAKEFYLLAGAFVFGHDKQNVPVLYMRAKIHKKWSKTLDESFRRYLSWQLNILTKSDHNNRGDLIKKTVLNSATNKMEKDGSFVICFDCADVGYSCLDMDFLKFIVNLLINYYPTYCRYALCLDLPWLFRSVWKLVKSWLPEDAQNTVQLITCKQITDFIEPNQVPNCIRYNDLKASEKPAENKHQLPVNWDSIPSIDVLGLEMGLAENEIKQFKAHVEKLRKEYEQLGAI